MTRSSRPGAFSPVDLRVYRAAWAQPGALTGILNWYRAMRLGSGRPASKTPIAPPLRLLWGDKDPASEPGLADASIQALRRRRSRPPAGGDALAAA